MMDSLAKRIAPHEASREVLRQSLDDAHFQGQAPVANLAREGFGAKQKLGCLPRQIGNDGKKGGGAARRAQGFRSDTAFPQGAERNVDAVEIAMIGRAILQMVDDLERGT